MLIIPKQREATVSLWFKSTPDWDSSDVYSRVTDVSFDGPFVRLIFSDHNKIWFSGVTKIFSKEMKGKEEGDRDE